MNGVNHYHIANGLLERTRFDMTDREIRVEILDKLEKMIDILKHGHDIEIRKEASGVKVLEIKKGLVK